MPSKHRITSNITPEFMQALEAHQAAAGLPSLAAALVDAAQRGLGFQGEARQVWGANAGEGFSREKRAYAETHAADHARAAGDEDLARRIEKRLRAANDYDE